MGQSTRRSLADFHPCVPFDALAIPAIDVFVIFGPAF